MPVKLNPKSDSYEALMWDIITDVHKYCPKQGDNVLDLGAHCGFFSLYCAARGANVKAYEPNQLLLVELVHSAAVAGDIGRGSITISPKAIWSTGGLGMLFERSDSSAAYTLMAFPEHTGGAPVQLESLHDALEDKIWDCVKVDIEGAEAEVFTESDPQDLERIRFLTMEIHHDLLSKADCEDLVMRVSASFPHTMRKYAAGKVTALVCWR